MTSRSLKVELHCHTVFSQDGLIGFDSLIRTAEAIGLDALAITDHDTVEGAREFQQRAQAKQAYVKDRAADAAESFQWAAGHKVATDMRGAVETSDRRVEALPQPGLGRVVGILEPGSQRFRHFQQRGGEPFEAFGERQSRLDQPLDRRSRLCLQAVAAIG